MRRNVTGRRSERIRKKTDETMNGNKFNFILLEWTDIYTAFGRYLYGTVISLE